MILAVALLLLAATPATDATGSSECPVSEPTVVALLTSSAPIEAARALILVHCDQAIAREIGLAALGDSEPTNEVLQAIADALDDPVETVRQAALIAAVRQKDFIRPVLAARLEDARPSRPRPASARADFAASALAAIEPGAINVRTGDDPDVASGNPDLRSERALDRRQAAARLCGKPFAKIELTAAGLPDCAGLDRAAAAMIAHLVMARSFAAEVAAFDTAPARLPTSAADILVVRSTGPSAKSFPPGTRLAASARVELKANDSVDLLDSRGTYTLRGPGTFVAGAALAGLASANTRSGAGAAPDQPRPRIGAVRSTAPGAAARPTPAALPRFPWPAPRPVKQIRIPAGLLGGPQATLDQVADRLQAGLRRASSGYETGLFSGPPGGFVLLTRLERIQQSGAPFDEARRFTEKGRPKASFMDMLNSLMGERPGYFRTIAFVVSDSLAIDPRSPVSAIPLDRIGEASELPRALGQRRLGNRGIYVLVYAFERPPGRPRRAWIEGAPTALQHLEASGIARTLALRR